MTEREKLLDFLEKGIMIKIAVTGHIDSSMLADLITEDRKRILAKLIEFTKEHPDCSYPVFKVINETLELSGLGKD